MTRIITERQLKDGLDIHWPDGRVEHGEWVVVRELPDGTFEVKEPQIGYCWVFNVVTERSSQSPTSP